MHVFVEVDSKSVVPLWVNNTQLPVRLDRLEPVTNYRTSEVVHYYQSADTDSCDAACDSAMAAFQKWKKAGVGQRRDLLLEVARLVEERAEELASLQVLEISCQEGFARMLVMYTAQALRELAYVIGTVSGSIPADDEPGATSFVFREPIGPVLVIPPWNGPLASALRSVAQVVAAGCTAVLKCSELSPASQAVIGLLFRDAGAPQGIVSTLQASRAAAPEITRALIANPSIRKIDFIGSSAVGSTITSMAGEFLKPVMLELSGKGPAIICEDADLDQAASLCVQGACFNHGQGCVATERIIVLRAAADDFLPSLIKRWDSFPTGMAVSVAAFANAQAHIQDAVDKGAKLLAGGPEPTAHGSLPATLLLIDAAANSGSMRIIDEETFGPSASVYIVDTVDEAVKLANHSKYGLTATIHSRSLQNALDIGQELEYAQVHINSVPLVGNPYAPAGGVKASGWGRNNAKWAFDEYLVEKHLTWRQGGQGLL
ncbi:aldehyde dehydrogenase [Fusarium albosuccineum]|uniref:Aldehyde dehydrogenase n=1 Tax=Fusarium albosuccineum TaxID=1237068 RepID=A0A8H4LKC1_9HYPO|nr:aldehyde dehydrogenase [Fusarium albosuccineum]